MCGDWLLGHTRGISVNGIIGTKTLLCFVRNGTDVEHAGVDYDKLLRLKSKCCVRPLTTGTARLQRLQQRVAPHLNACPPHCLCAKAMQNSVQSRCETHHTALCPRPPTHVPLSPWQAET